MDHQDRQDRQYTKCTPESTSSTTGTMLLISSSTKDLDRMNSQLESLGYECLVAETIEAARATLDSVSIDIIAIASSLVAPAPLRVIREAQSQRPWLRAVVFGGAPNPETVVEAIRQGVSDWINLPVDRARLIVSERLNWRHLKARVANSVKLAPKCLTRLMCSVATLLRLTSRCTRRCPRLP